MHSPMLPRRHYVAGRLQGHLPGARRYKGGGGGGTSTTTSEPWEEQKPYLETGFQQAGENVLNRQLSYFPGSTVVPFAPETTAALGAQTNRAIQGSPVLGAAQDYTQQLLTDPGSSPIFDAIMSSVKPQVDSTFSRAGRTGGSPLAMEALSRGVSRGMAPVMESAAGRAPGLAAADYADIDRLKAVGTRREGQAGARLDESIGRFNFAQSEPTNRIAQYMGLVQGNYGGTSTQTTRQDTNPLLMGLGAATSLAPLAVGKCWVAREVYGVENPQWIQFRRWLLERAPSWFCWVYIQYGSAFAGWLRRHPRWKIPIRRWMDSKIVEG